MSAARKFATPILLSVLFLPFIFVLSVYSVYEQVFYVKISDDFLADHLSYYVEGDEIAAKRLKLVLDVHGPKNASASDERFLLVANTLARKAISSEIDRVRLLSEDWHDSVAGRKVSVRREQWQGTMPEGYSRKFIIEIG